MPNLSMEDAELLAAAHLDLLAAQAEGVIVLGRSDRADLIHAALTRQAQTTTVMAVLPLATNVREVAA